MKQISLRLISIVLAILIIVSLAGCSKGNNLNVLSFLDYHKATYAADKDLNGVVCENDAWQLIWDDENKSVSFYDKYTDTMWGNTATEITDLQNLTGITLPQLNSAVTVVYQDPTSLDEVLAYSYDSAYEYGNILVKKIENGIRVIYDFVEYEFCIPVEYTINEDSFDVRINPLHIAQGDLFTISGVKVAPFICGVENTAEDSWLFIPDGSGAIVEPFTSDTLGVFGEAEVYGHDLTTQLYGYGNSKAQIYMPVYGVKKGDKALLAVIDSSANAASISWEIGSETFGFSTVYPTFRLRGTNLISRPDNFISITTLSEINVFTDGILKDEIRIKYYSLAGDDASISGMANKYRDYLIENQGLKKSANLEKNAAFKYVGGTVLPEFILGVPSEKLYTLTDCESAANMTNELVSKLGNNISVNLVGFGNSGVDVGAVGGGFKTAAALGGNSGMKELMNTFKNLGVNSYMDFDLITFNETGSGFDKNSSAVYASGQLVTYTGFEFLSHIPDKDDIYYVLSRSNLFKATDILINKAKDMNLSGISLSALSSTIYSDYANQDYYACGKMPADVKELFAKVKSGGYNVLSSSANVYAALASDEIFDAPLYSSKYSFESNDVPFYQMVFRGYIPMSSTAINLATDRKDALLRCVSSGIAPAYTLYDNYSTELVTSNHSFIYASVYDSNKDEIVEEVKSVTDFLSSIEGAYITDYTVDESNVAVTTFSNGVYVAVNYSNNDASTFYGEIAAKSWISGVN